MEFYNERLISVASYTRRGRLPGHGLCFWFAGEEWKRLFEAGKEKQHAGNRLPLNVFSCGRQRKKERFRERSVRRNLKKQALPWRAWQGRKRGWPFTGRGINSGRGAGRSSTSMRFPQWLRHPCTWLPSRGFPWLSSDWQSGGAGRLHGAGRNGREFFCR